MEKGAWRRWASGDGTRSSFCFPCFVGDISISIYISLLGREGPPRDGFYTTNLPFRFFFFGSLTGGTGEQGDHLGRRELFALYTGLLQGRIRGDIWTTARWFLSRSRLGPTFMTSGFMIENLTHPVSSMLLVTTLQSDVCLACLYIFSLWLVPYPWWWLFVQLYLINSFCCFYLFPGSAVSSYYTYLTWLARTAGGGGFISGQSI